MVIKWGNAFSVSRSDAQHTDCKDCRDQQRPDIYRDALHRGDAVVKGHITAGGENDANHVTAPKQRKANAPLFCLENPPSIYPNISLVRIFHWSIRHGTVWPLFKKWSAPCGADHFSQNWDAFQDFSIPVAQPRGVSLLRRLYSSITRTRSPVNDMSIREAPLRSKALLRVCPVLAMPDPP